jgi:hypothetical protein
MPLALVLDAVGPFDRAAPAGSVVIARPDADIGILLLGPSEPSGDEPAVGFGEGRGMALRKGCLVVDELLQDEAGETRWFLHHRRARLQGVLGIGDALVAAQVVEAAIFGAEDQLRHAVAIEIGHRGGGVVTGDISLGDVADLLQDDPAIGFADMAIPDGVLRIDQQVESAVAIPVGHGQLGSPAAPGRVSIELEGLEVLVDEDTFRPAAAAAQGQVALLVEGDEVELAVPVVVHDQRGGAPLREGVAAGSLPPLPSGRVLLQSGVEDCGLHAPGIARAA